MQVLLKCYVPITHLMHLAHGIPSLREPSTLEHHFPCPASVQHCQRLLSYVLTGKHPNSKYLFSKLYHFHTRVKLKKKKKIKEDVQSLEVGEHLVCHWEISLKYSLSLDL